MIELSYTPTEKLSVKKPVERVKYITNICINKNVLDLGCFDETALIKENSTNYLFQQISNVSAVHIGVDNSKLLPAEGITYSENVKILQGDIYDLNQMGLQQYKFDVIIAGELIEHLPNTLQFFLNLKRDFSGQRIICSTPNTTSFSNMVLALFKRESCHVDHYQVYSYKTLNTLCRTAKFKSWQIIPYNVKFTEMIMRSSGIKKQLIKFSEKIINGIEYLFPLTGGGYLIDIEI
jgi:hypothetical protein